MILADTNVLSEPLRTLPDQAVLAWLGEHAKDIALTTITIGELTRNTRDFDVAGLQVVNP